MLALPLGQEPGVGSGPIAVLENQLRKRLDRLACSTAQLTAPICNADNRVFISSSSQDRGFMSLFTQGSRRNSLLVGLLITSSFNASSRAHAQQTQPTPPIYGGNPRS